MKIKLLKADIKWREVKLEQCDDVLLIYNQSRIICVNLMANCLLKWAKMFSFIIWSL